MYYSKPRTGYDKLLYTQHIERMKNIKKTIDNEEPIKKKYVNKYKAEQKLFDSRIQYENRMMLERIAKNIQEHQLDNTPSKSHQLHYSFMRKMSCEKRLRELKTIQQNNQKLLYNIQNAQPEYNRNVWEEEYKERHEKMKQMLIYPELYQKRIAS